MVELEPCPFCGGRAVIFSTQYGTHIECEFYDPDWHRVQITEKTRDKAIEKWNRRYNNGS